MQQVYWERVEAMCSWAGNLEGRCGCRSQGQGCTLIGLPRLYRLHSGFPEQWGSPHSVGNSSWWHTSGQVQGWDPCSHFQG